MSPENCGAFQLLEEMAFHCSTVSVFGSFARHASAFSSVPQTPAQGRVRFMRSLRP